MGFFSFFNYSPVPNNRQGGGVDLSNFNKRELGGVRGWKIKQSELSGCLCF